MAADSRRPLLIQFARAPVKGRVKTRMIPFLSPGQACDLHSELVLWTCSGLIASGLGAVELAVAGDSDHALFARCRELGLAGLTTQAGADLGHNMYCAIRTGLARYDRVLLVGSDCPAMDKNYLTAALDALERAPLVLGPAEDGGYVLIGASAVYPELFAGIPWGTSKVFSATTARLRRLGLPWVELPPLADIDRPEDLPAWQALRELRRSRPAR